MANKTRYPAYDVMKEQDHWDEHTRSIVKSRFVKPEKFQFLTLLEREMLRAVAAILSGDERAHIIQYVIGHIDETLSKTYLEGQREEGIPRRDVLIRRGLALLEKEAQSRHLRPFIGLNKEMQETLLQELSINGLELPDEYQNFPQRHFFKKLLKLVLESYYSHPDIWSEIGYGGPAYPRGYVRVQKGQLDPWEAQPES